MKAKVISLGIIGLSAALLAGCSSFSLSPRTWFGSWSPVSLFDWSSKKYPELAVIGNPQNPMVLWSANVGKSQGYAFVPALGDALVVAAGADSGISSLSDNGGKVVTHIDTPQRITGGVGANDNLIVVGQLKGDVLAFDGSGRSLWKYAINGDVIAPPAVVASSVVVRTADGRIIALDKTDGKRKWVYQRATPALTLRTNAGVLINRSNIYAGYPGGKLVAIEFDSGKPIWEATISLPKGSTELERISDVSSIPVLDETRVCVAVFQGRTGCLETLNGNVLWARDIASSNGVAIDAKMLYVSDSAGNVQALDKTNGASVWKQEKLAARNPSTPVMLNGRVLVGDETGMVHVLSTENGALLGRVETDGSTIKSLVALGDRVIAQTDKGGVYALTLK